MLQFKRLVMRSVATFLLASVSFQMSCAPAQLPSSSAPSVALYNVATATSEPPAFKEHDGLYCYTPEQGTEFLHWRVAQESSCEEQVAKAQTKARVMEVRAGGDDLGFSWAWLGVVFGVAVAAFGAGLGVGAVVKK